MMRIVILISCILILAACQQPEKKGITMNESGTNINLEEKKEEKPPLVQLNEINQLGNDSFTDSDDRLPDQYIMSINEDYTYFMYQMEDMYGNYDGIGHLSVMKGDKWIIKDKEFPIATYNPAEYVMLGNAIVLLNGDNQTYYFIELDEKGEVSEELPLDVPTSKDTMDLTTMSVVPTSKGNTVHFTDVDLVLDPINHSLVPDDDYISYVDFEKNISYDLDTTDGTMKGYDLKKQDNIYNEEDGQEKTWILPSETIRIMGQKDKNYYTYSSAEGNMVDINLYDQHFIKIYTLPVSLVSEDNIRAKVTMINDNIYVYQMLLFKGKPSLRVTLLQ